jgi:histidine ammonia-lyase
MALDHLKAGVSELAGLSERRIFRLTTGNLSGRLPALLAHQPGMGQMVPQTTAAALVSENRSLAMPSSVDSLPTCEDQEDIVAMSTTAARRCAEVIANAQAVVAIELLCAAKGLQWRQERGEEVLGKGTAAALAVVAEALPEGGVPSDHIRALTAVVRSGAVSGAAREAAGV